MVGFSILGAYGKIFIMRVKECMDGVEGEDVARQVNCNREWTQIYANSWERDRPGRRGARLATRPGKKDTKEDVFGGTPNTAVDPSPLRFDGKRTTALLMDRISEHLRPLAPFAVPLRFLIFQHWLMQVVDFH
jgi:hypothetical protein